MKKYLRCILFILVVDLFSPFKIFALERRVKLSVLIDGPQAPNSIWLSCSDGLLSRRIYEVGHDGKTSYFSIDSVYGVVYFSLESKNGALLDKYILEGGDSVNVRIMFDKNKNKIGGGRSFTSWGADNYLGNLDGYQVEFNGKGSEKYTIKYMIDDFSSSAIALAFEGRYGSFSENNGARACLAYAFALLEAYRYNLSSLVYNTMRADFVGEFDGYVLKQLLMRPISHEVCVDSDFFKFSDDVGSISPGGRIESWALPEFAINRAKFLTVCSGKSLDYRLVFTRLMCDLHGAFRDKILARYVKQEFAVGKDPTNLIKSAIAALVDTSWKKEYNQILRVLSEPGAGFNTKLVGSRGQTVTLNEFKNKVVFLDFWFTGCANCVTYYNKILSGVERDFSSDTNIVFVSISVDADVSEWKKSLASGEYTSKAAINLYTGGFGLEHPIIDQYHVTAFPRPLLFSKNGFLVKNAKLLQSSFQLAHELNELLAE